MITPYIEHSHHLKTYSFVFGLTFKFKIRLTVKILTSGSCCFCSIFIHHNFGFLECLGYMHRLST